MPRTNLGKTKEPYSDLKRLLWGVVKKDNAPLQEGAAKLGMSASTLCRRCKDPGSMTVEELLKFGRKYHIPIDDLRAVIQY